MPNPLPCDYGVNTLCCFQKFIVGGARYVLKQKTAGRREFRSRKRHRANEKLELSARELRALDLPKLPAA